ncbi:sensor domain-containing diguanylate cyclase [Pseudidiomarina marina]|uniref:diguanylate cyclase domain-containing protein n=1 Tax=Pseudidiomarina marina TaxID=502366 RepID=UPI00384B58C6
MFSTRTRRASFIVAVLASLLFALVAIEYLHGLNKERVKSQQLSELQTEFTAVRADLESELNAALYSTWGIASYLATHPESDPQQWRAMAQPIVDGNTFVRNLAIAPDNIISFVYPTVGNEAVLGYDYERNPEQRDVVKRAQTTKKTLLAGPVALVQGGEGLIYRIPIYNHEGDAERYWGLLALVIDSNRLFEATGVLNLAAFYDLAIRGRDGTGADGDVFFGNETTFASADFLEKIRFPNGTWSVALSTDSHIEGNFWEQQRIRLIGYPFVVALYIMLFTLFAWYRSSYSEAMADPLTNVANRRMIMERLQTLVQINERHPTPFAVVVVDIDRFKNVNDQFGHQAGDTVLKTTAQRMFTNTRATDTVARIGGDEFLIVLMGVSDEKTVTEQCAKIADVIIEPIRYKSNEITITASLGYALFGKDTKTVEALIQRADHKMYKNKRRT